METAQNDFTMRVSMLGSSSSGNATYIETPKRKILVDAGFSGKKMKELLAGINRDINEIDSLFITHEHSDHIKGMGVLARKYDLNVYANEATWQAIGSKVGVIPVEKQHVMEQGDILTLGDVDIVSYGVSHDAAEPQFYAFQKGSKQFVMLTDTGYVSNRLKSQLRNASAYLIESNHEIEMLRYGQYPWSLKQRILSDKGHLSNEAGTNAMIEMIGDQTKEIYLGHLSRDNNTKELAMSTMFNSMSAKDMRVNEDFTLHMTDPAQSTKLLYL